MKLKITSEETRTICQFVVDGLVCVISKENNSDEAVGFVKGVKLFSGNVKNIEETAKLIKKEIENNRVNIEKRIKIGRKKMVLIIISIHMKAGCLIVKEMSKLQTIKKEINLRLSILLKKGISRN